MSSRYSEGTRSSRTGRIISVNGKSVPRRMASLLLIQSSVIGTGSIWPSAQRVSSQPEMTASTSCQVGQWTIVRSSFCL